MRGYLKRVKFRNYILFNVQHTHTHNDSLKTVKLLDSHTGLFRVKSCILYCIENLLILQSVYKFLF